MAIFSLPYLQSSRRKTLKGVAFPMRTDGIGGYLTVNENLGSLRDGIIQLILTSRGARVMRPDFGTDLKKSVFEPLDDTTIENLTRQILSTVAKYEPRVVVKSLKLTPRPDDNRIRVVLTISSKEDLNAEELIDVTVQ